MRGRSRPKRLAFNMLSKMSSILQPKNAVFLYDRKTRCRDVACVEGMLVQVRPSGRDLCSKASSVNGGEYGAPVLFMTPIGESAVFFGGLLTVTAASPVGWCFPNRKEYGGSVLRALGTSSWARIVTSPASVGRVPGRPPRLGTPRLTRSKLNEVNPLS